MASRSRWLAFGALGSLLILCVALFAVLGPPSETVAPEASPETEPGPVPDPEKAEERPASTGVTTFSGRVLTSEGDPAAPAEVTAHLLADDGWRVGPDNPPEGVAEADTEGRFSMSLCPGVYLLLARAGEERGFLPLIRVPLPPGRELTIRLLPSAAISGGRASPQVNTRAGSSRISVRMAAHSNSTVQRAAGSASCSTWTAVRWRIWDSAKPRAVGPWISGAAPSRPEARSWSGRPERER